MVTPQAVPGQPARRNLTQLTALELTALAKTRPRPVQYRPGLPGGLSGLASTSLDLTPLCNPRH